MSDQIKSSETEYFSKFAISNSAIKDWKAMSPKAWHDRWIAKTAKRPARPATTMGSLLDCIIFTPADYDKRFLVSETALPSPKVTLILNETFEHIRELNKNITELNAKNKTNVPHKEYDLLDKELVVSFCKKHEHYPGKPDQAYNDVLKKDNGYFAFLASAKGRLVITAEQKQAAEDLKKILYTNPVSKPFLDPKKGCEVVFQQRIYAEYELEGFENLDFLPIKGAIDIIHINHKSKTVREVDLKLTDDAFLFEESIKRFDYIGQHSYYEPLVKYWLSTYKDGKYADYTIANPLNLVMDDGLRIPYIYAYNANDLEIKRKGIENTKIKGWEDVLREIAWHIDTQQWERPREHYLNGFINVQAFTRR
jgi:hypothetical protein